MSAEKTTRIMAIRHGETVWNREERFQGHGDSPLTARGRHQAEALGRRLRHLEISALIASDLGRTRETAALIAAATGHEVNTDIRLRERAYGVLEGLTLTEIKSNHPQTYGQLMDDNPDYEVPEGESRRHQYQRNVSVLEEIRRNRTGETLLLVAHGGVLDNFFRFVTGQALQQPRCFLIPNTSLCVISYGRFYGTRRWVIETWGDTSHLNGGRIDAAAQG